MDRPDNCSINDKLIPILNRVQKPGRYAGGEWNAVQKDWSQTDVKIAFAFPDVYEVGMSHLGLQILYGLVNAREDALMERVFAPWTDMEQQMREQKLPLFSLESRRPLDDFDMIGFTWQYELAVTNILNMLDLAGLPIYSAQRTQEHYPLVLVGGPCAFNPEPLADFIDLFVVGEGEPVLPQLIEAYQKSRELGENKATMMRRLAKIDGIYVPSLYQVRYNENNMVEAVIPQTSDLPLPIVKTIVPDMDQVFFPTQMVVPALEAVHDRAMLEVQRGCTRGCRFCQAGIIYRPVREKTPPVLMEQARQMLRSTGWGEIALTSLSTADYSHVDELIKDIVQTHGPCGVNVSLPSLRVDAFSVDLAQQVQKVRRSSLTFAPEAGTQRLRDVINKNVTQQDLLAATAAAFKGGWQAIKLYFMIGLPTETDEDLAGIITLAHQVLEQGRQYVTAKSRLKVTVSVSSFVPKAHTVFQWQPLNSREELRRKQNFLRAGLKTRGLAFKWHDPENSFLEAVISRGDRRLGQAIAKAWHSGCRFDGWSEKFDALKWQQAFNEVKLDPAHYAHRRYEIEHTLPWDHIDAGVSKKFLVREYQRALAMQSTADCRAGLCVGCGLCTTMGVKPVLAGGEHIAPL